MATIRTEIEIDARPQDVWDAMRDWGSLHERLVPGFVVDARVEGGDRVVTFFNGAVARERIVACDDDERRLVWSIVDSPLDYEHHNGAAQVLDAGGGRSRFVWTADFLPDRLESIVRPLQERGTQTVKATLEQAAPAPRAA